MRKDEKEVVRSFMLAAKDAGHYNKSNDYALEHAYSAVLNADRLCRQRGYKKVGSENLLGIYVVAALYGVELGGGRIVDLWTAVTLSPDASLNLPLLIKLLRMFNGLDQPGSDRDSLLLSILREATEVKDLRCTRKQALNFLSAKK